MAELVEMGVEKYPLASAQMEVWRVEVGLTTPDDLAENLGGANA
jgi:hypothetical protein